MRIGHVARTLLAVVTLALVAVSPLHDTLSAEGCCSEKLKATQEKIQGLIASWQSESQKLGGLCAESRQQLGADMQTLAGACPVGGRMMATLGFVKDAVAAIQAADESCQKSCASGKEAEATQGQGAAKTASCEKLAAVINARRELLASVSTLLEVTVATTSGACAGKACEKAAAGSGKEVSAAAGCCESAKTSAVAKQPACESAKTAPVVAASKGALCEKSAQTLAAEILASDCEKKAAQLVIAKVAGLSCEQKAAALVAEIRASGCEKAATAILTKAASECQKACSAAGKETSVAPDCCEKAKATSASASACPKALASRAQEISRSWEKAPADLVALGSEKQLELRGRFTAIQERTAAPRLAGESLMALHEAFEILAALDAQILKAVAEDAELVKAVPQEARQRFEAQTELVRETAALLGKAKGTLEALPKESPAKK
jgi:hypothetical protein